MIEITVKTGGLLGEHLPAGSNDQAVLELQNGTSINQVLEKLEMPVEDFYLIILNDQVVPVEERAKPLLNEGDELGIYPPLKGG